MPKLATLAVRSEVKMVVNYVDNSYCCNYLYVLVRGDFYSDIYRDSGTVQSMDYRWISFEVDLRKALPQYWMLLGEARSKCDHLSHIPLPKEYAEQLHLITLAKGAHATTAIEGNTLTEEEVRALVEQSAGRSKEPRGKAQPPRQVPDYQRQEVLNIIAAYNAVADGIAKGDIPEFTPELIRAFNEAVLTGLDNLETGVVPGELRTHPVAVGPYRAPDHTACDELLARMCTWLNGAEFAGDGAMRIPTAIIRASLAHLYLAWIHPFGDGNGRTARLCEFVLLVTCGVPTSAAHLIANHCNTTRDDYYEQLRYASESGGDVTRFLLYCAEGFVIGLTEQLGYIYDRQFRLTWKEYVAQQVTGRDPAVRERRSLIAEALLFVDPVPKKAIPDLTAELARAYTFCGPRTLGRDLNELVALGLLTEGSAGFSANDDVLLTLLPLSVPEISSVAVEEQTPAA